MLFNSFEFAVFLPVVFLLYWFVFNRSVNGQNLFIVVASYVFYAWWDWRFLGLIVFTSLCSYASGLLIDKYRETPRKAKLVRAVPARILTPSHQVMLLLRSITIPPGASAVFRPCPPPSEELRQRVRSAPGTGKG